MRLQPELPLRAPGEPPPTGVIAMRVVGLAVGAASIVASCLAEPGPGLSGRGPLVALCVLAVGGGILVGAPRRDLPPGYRLLALIAIGSGSIGLVLLQGDQSASISGIYIAAIFAGLRLPDRQALCVLGLAVGGGAIAYATSVDDPGSLITVLVGVPPWFFVMRVMRAQRARQIATDALVEELRASRAAEAAAAAEGERTRVARDLHDVLAHSLSALTIQLELARVQARGADPALAATVTDAHARAVTGLDEARRAIGTLRGDDLPGPERLAELVEAFGAEARLTVSGSPRELPSEARVAVYRVAQEALTNARRHADADRVEVALVWTPGAVELRVVDRAAARVGAREPRASPGGGHGLTGMRERAELLGGQLEAGPTADGFAVSLWLPA